MSFWEDASGLVKGAIIFGVLGALYLGAAYVLKFPPYMEDESQQTRGLTAP
jgi:hypothetical protein